MEVNQTHKGGTEPNPSTGWVPLALHGVLLKLQCACKPPGYLVEMQIPVR